MSEKEELVEIYKIHVEMADNVSKRRLESNNFYMTLLSGLFAVLAFISKEKISIPIGNDMIMLSFGLFGILISIVWFFNIKSYRSLNSGKFYILHELEKNIGFAFLTKEWNHIRPAKGNKRYIQLTRIEAVTPFIISIPFWILFVYAILNMIK